MTIGQLVDFVIAYNDRQKKADEAAKKAAEMAETKKKAKRRATQEEINSFFG